MSVTVLGFWKRTIRLGGTTDDCVHNCACVSMHELGACFHPKLLLKCCSEITAEAIFEPMMPPIFQSLKGYLHSHEVVVHRFYKFMCSKCEIAWKMGLEWVRKLVPSKAGNFADEQFSAFRILPVSE